MIATTSVERRMRSLRAPRLKHALATPSLTRNGRRREPGSWSSWAFCVSGTERRPRLDLLRLCYASKNFNPDAKLKRQGGGADQQGCTLREGAQHGPGEGRLQHPCTTSPFARVRRAQAFRH